MPHPGEALALLAHTAPLQSVALGASPYSYVAPANGAVVVQGGTVSLLELGRGTFVSVGVLAGVVPVVAGDVVRVTYAVAPTMTFFRG